MPFFRKKPVVIEARQLTDTNSAEIAQWCKGSNRDMPNVTIPTLEGDMTASVGDWIIKGVKGEFYPCKPDIFEKTYESTEHD